MLVTKEIPALWNGVSQQAATSRLASQAEAQVNCYPSVVDGLRKRPPTVHVAKLTSSDLGAAHLHLINRDTSNRFQVVITNGDLKVYGLDGVEKTVSFPHGKGYLSASTPITDFKCVSVADYTFVLNKTKVVDMAAVGDDTTAQASDYYATTGYYYGDDLTGSYLGAVYGQYPPNPAGGSYLGEVQAFEKLPTTATNGSIYKVRGTDATGFATYYVRKNGSVWDETVALGIKNRINAETMPWALVRKADGTFEFSPFSWADRKVGDETTNPNPSFVGKTIRDVFFYKNRLGFAVEEGCVMSRIGDFGNFYRLTVVQLLTDEVIDIQASDTKVTQIHHAVPFDAGMMLFSDQVQFRVTEGSDSFGPTTAGLKVATQYTMKTAVRPFPIGSDVYFVVENGDWAQVREYFVRDNAVGTDAADITGHVPKYIPAGVTSLSGSATHDVLFAVTSGAPSRLYCYKYYWTDNNDKPQSAWSYFQFDSDVTVLATNVIDNDLYLLLKRGDGAHLERMPLEAGNVVSGLGFQVHLDRRSALTGTWLPASGQTEWTLPYPVDASVRDTFRIVRGPAFSTAKGAVVSLSSSDYVWMNSTTVRVAGNYSAGVCYVGKKYEQRYRFSPQYMKSRDNVAILSGRLQLRTMSVHFRDTAYFRTEIATYGTDVDGTDVIPSTFSNFDGKTVGQATLVLGSPNFSTGAYQFGVYGDATVATIDLVNDSPYSATFTQAEWEGFWHNRARNL